MQKIIPHLWFDTQAREAADFYTGLFPDSTIRSHVALPGTPGGDSELVEFDLSGYRFMAISAGPHFRINPSISFMVNFDPSRLDGAEEQLRAMWEGLSGGGQALMELGEYPFSRLYGWIQDRFGVSWQLILTDPEGEDRPFIIPSLLFVGDVVGRAEEATDFYISVFEGSRRGQIARYGPGQEPDLEGTTTFTDFQLAGGWFAAMDSGHEHGFAFNEAVSLLVDCDSQDEVDYFWEKLSAVPEAEQCGWLKDRYGLSWQINPSRMSDMLANGTPEQLERVTQAFLPMKKLDLSVLEEAYRG